MRIYQVEHPLDTGVCVACGRYIGVGYPIVEHDQSVYCGLACARDGADAREAAVARLERFAARARKGVAV